MKLILTTVCTLVLISSAIAKSTDNKVLTISKPVNQEGQIKTQELLPCPAGTVTYGDSCKKTSEICTDKEGHRGLIMAGKCNIGARP